MSKETKHNIRTKLRDWLLRHPHFNPYHFSFSRGFRTITNPMRILPDFIIIGYHKCGTSSLYHYIVQHPNIRHTSVKEVHYFDLSYWRDTGWYKSHFPTKLYKNYFEKKHKLPFITGECSPLYAFHPKVPERIKKLVPNVKLIVILRNPVDRCYSLYHQYIRLGYDMGSFEEVVKKDKEQLDFTIRKFLNDEVRAYNVRQDLFPLVSMGVYEEHLKNWLKIFSKEQFLFVKSEDLETNTQKTLDKIFEFLQVPEFRFESFEKQNVGEYKAMNQKTREALEEFYRPHNKKLEELLGMQFNWD